MHSVTARVKNHGMAGADATVQYMSGFWAHTVFIWHRNLSQLEWMQRYLSALWGHLSGTGTCYSVCYQFWINVKTSFMKILHLLSLICSIFTGVDPDLDPQSFWIRFSLKHVYNQEVVFFSEKNKNHGNAVTCCCEKKKKKLLLEEDKKCDPVLL